MSQLWRGVFTIPCTPFTETGALDLDSLRREIVFCLEAGAHGIVAPVNASEFWTLSDEERKTVAQVIVQAVDGHVPTVIGVTGAAAPLAVMLARHAEQIGANAVIALPPHVRTASPAVIFDYFRALSESISIPIFVQNHDAPAGTRMAPEFIAQLVRELEHVDWIKEETFPAGHAIQAEIALCGPKLKGVMGGVAGRYLLDEYRRGSCGTMPACEVTDIHVQIWEALDGGDEQEARHLHSRLLPLLNYEALLPGVYKSVLKRRGIIASDYLRSEAGNPLDALDHQELGAILDSIRELFRLAPPM
ncbi:MAG TPA: dihydrodipicolinate synthase family protein [Ktedonobacteraceae bacterium]